MFLKIYALAIRASLVIMIAFLTSTHVAASPVLTPFNASLIVEAGKATPKPPFYRLQTVIIDAGHGGKDPGGMGGKSKEKHIALSIAQLLADQIKVSYPEITVIMTRDDDTFIPLYERAAIANRNKADLFISIHANIMPGSKATFGTETFVMGQHVSEHNLDVAKRENASVLLEADYESNYDYDPTSDEGHILMSMYQSAFLDHSILFASLVEQHFAESAGRKSRGVKQAGFVVLKETAMPSVLVETGFMSNSKEEKYLLSDKGQRELSNAIFQAFTAYRQLLDKKSLSIPATAAQVELSPVRSLSSQDLQQDMQTQQSSGSLASREVAPKPPVIPTAQPVARPVPAEELRVNMPERGGSGPETVVLKREFTAKSVDVAPTGRDMSKVVEADYQPAVLSKEVSNQVVSKGSGTVIPTVYQQTAPPAAPTAYQFPTTEISRPALPVQTEDNLIYAVQLTATPRPLARSEAKWDQVNYPIHVAEENGMYKYQARGMNDPMETMNARQKLRLAGFEGAFIVIYRGGQRLSAEEVSALMQ